MFKQRVEKQRAYRLETIKALKRAGFFLKKQVSRDGDEYIVRISAPQGMLERAAEKNGNFKVKLKSQVILECVADPGRSLSGEDLEAAKEKALNESQWDK